MTVFSELYSAYYNAVADILKKASDHLVTQKEIRETAQKAAFSESMLSIVPALTEERWQVLRKDGRTVLDHDPTMPLTLLQKRWLKAIFLDPRIRLFEDQLPEAPDVEPLFTPEDVAVVDRYADGDPYEDVQYRAHFRLILNALNMNYPLQIDYTSGKGKHARLILMPRRLEYSEKDDKFRLIGEDSRRTCVINVGRIVSVRPYAGQLEWYAAGKEQDRAEVVLEVVDQRNALERVLMHFAHFEKEAEKLDDLHYRVTIRYDRDDETEMVIRILSFGPLVHVTGPDRFVHLIRERLMLQKHCGLI